MTRDWRPGPTPNPGFSFGIATLGNGGTQGRAAVTTKGVFIPTSSFSKHRVGAQVKRTLHVLQIDEDFFD